MLRLVIPAQELFDDDTGEFIQAKETVLRLEHSLVSLSKWESKWKKPFLDRNRTMSVEEFRDYVRCMTLDQHVDPVVYTRLTANNIKTIQEYISTEQTATWFNDKRGRAPSRDVLTSELIYYYMTAFNIPFECQKWHLSRLLVLLRICGIKNEPSKKMSPKSVMTQNHALNAARRKAHHTKG